MNKFLNDLASKNPTPGGGTAAAVVGAMAAALVEMVVNLTKDEKCKSIGEDAKKLRLKLLELGEKDSIAFDAVMTAYKTRDKKKIKESLIGAIKVPMETKKTACEVEKLARKIVKLGNKNAVSDAKSAIHLAAASQKSANENIKINNAALKSLIG